MPTAVLPLCPFSSTCFTSGISHRTHPEGEPCIAIYKCVFWHFVIFFFPGRWSFLVLSAPWHAGSPPGHHGASLALPEVRDTCSMGSKWQVPTGRHSNHVEPSRPMQTHVQVKKMPDGSCDMWDLDCRQCRQTLLGDGNVERMSGVSCTG